jgi:cytochrome b559 alpha subunit
LQDRRYWLIHSVTIFLLFFGGIIFIISGFIFILFGSSLLNNYFTNDTSQLFLINDRFSALSELDDF